MNSEDRSNSLGWRDAISLVVLAAGSIILRLAYLNAYLQAMPDALVPSNDAFEYWEMGRTIYRDGWLLPGHGPFYQAPGYSYILAALHHVGIHDIRGVVTLQAGLGVVNVLLVYAIARRAMPAWHALSAAGLFGLCPYALFFESKIVASVCGLFFLLICSYLLLIWMTKPRWYWLAASSICCGAAILVRPNFVFTVPFLAGSIWNLARNQKWIRTTGFIAVLILTVSPVTIRNGWVGGDWVPISANAGVTLYMGTNPQAQGGLSAVEGLSSDIAEQKEGSIALASERAGKTLTPSQASWYWVKQTVEWIARHPVRFILLEIKKALWALYPYPPAVNYSIHFESQFVSLLRGLLLFHWLLVTGGLVIIPSLFVKKDPVSRLALCMAAGYISVSLVYYASDRFLYAMVPFLAVAIAIGARHADWSRLSGPSPRLIWPVVCLALTLNPWCRPNRGQEIGLGYYNLGVFYERRGEPDPALDAYRRSLEYRPRYISALLNIGVLYARRGDLERSNRYFEQVLEIDPTHEKARRNLDINLRRIR